MNNFLDNIKPAIRSIAAYHLNERNCEVKLNQNESPFDLPDSVKDEIMEKVRARDWNRYPAYTSGLREGLARYVGSDPEQILTGNGSNELLSVVFNAVMSSGKKLLLIAPTFKIYEQLATAAQCEIVQLEFETDWTFPVDKIVTTLKQETIDLCIICTPNSPTGSLMPPQDLKKILESTQGLVLVDGAYHEFTEINYSGLLRFHHNMLLTRTFSKAFGLAGLRIGYLVADGAMAAELYKAKLPYNLNIFSETTAIVLLQRQDIIKQNIQTILAEKKRITAELRKNKNLRTHTSSSNFFMIESEFPAAVLFERFAEKGVLLRDISGYHPSLQNHLRVTVGTPEENDRLLQAASEIF